MKKCKECGKEYDEDMNFCPYCGIVNEEKNKAVSVADEEPEEQEVLEQSTEKASSEQEDMLQEDAEGEALEVEKEPAEGEALEEEKEPTEEELKAALEAAKAAGESKRIKKEMSETSDEEEEAGAELPKNRLPMIIGITVIIGILIIAGVVVAIYYGTNKPGASEEYTKVVEEYMLGYQNKDVNRIMNTYPQFMKDNILSNSTPEDIWKDIDKSFSETLGDDWKATYTMGAVATISDSDITALKSDLQSTYNTTLDFTSGYWVAADMTLTGKGDSSTMPLIFAVVQVDGKWAIVYQTYNTTGTGSSSQGQGGSVTEGAGQGSATE